MAIVSKRRMSASCGSGCGTCPSSGPTRTRCIAPSSISWPTPSTRCHGEARSRCVSAGARPRPSPPRAPARGAWPSRSRTPVPALRRPTSTACSTRSFPPKKAARGSASPSRRRSSRITAAPSTSATTRARARSSVSCCRSCRTCHWTRDMTIDSGDAAALRRGLEDAHARIAALEREIAAARGLESLGRRTLGIAHDLRNVMAAIGAQTELLLGVVPAETPQRRRVEAIRRASDWGARLAHGLLAAGRPPSTPNEVTDLNTVVSGVVRTLAPSFGNIDVQTQLEPRIGTIAAGAAALEQIAMNLILNARDAMPGGGRMTIRTALAGHRNGASAEAPAIFSVEDTGIGMDEATRARAFEPYFTTKAADKGMGLGLSIVHDIVTRHGGHVNISSAPGRGTTLTVTLPRAGGEARDAVVLVLVDEAGVRDLIVDI